MDSPIATMDSRLYRNSCVMNGHVHFDRTMQSNPQSKPRVMLGTILCEPTLVEHWVIYMSNCVQFVASARIVRSYIFKLIMKKPSTLIYTCYV